MKMIAENLEKKEVFTLWLETNNLKYAILWGDVLF